MLYNQHGYNEVGYNASGIVVTGYADSKQTIYYPKEKLADTAQMIYKARSAFADTEQRLYILRISFADTEQLITIAKFPKRYMVALYDRHRNLLAVLEQALNVSYTRRIGAASEVSFSLPASDPKAQLFEQARYFDLYRGEERIVSARIERRDTSGNPYTISGYTNEIKLRDYTTPSSWTYDGWEAMDAVRDLLLEFRTFVKQSKADWDASAEMQNIDTQTQPTRNGDVCLAKRASGHYYSEGYLVTQPIDLGADVFRIARIRWQQTVGEEVSISIRTRTGPTPTPDSSWSAWSAAQSVSVPDDSAITGVPCTSPTDRYIQLMIILATRDTTTPNEDKTVFGFTPILHAVEVVARYKTPLQVGNVPESIGLQLQGVEFDYSNHLDAMIQLCEKIKYEWEIDGDDRINLAPELGTDKSHEVILHESLNTNITVLRDEPGEIVNVLTALGAGDGLAQLRLTLQDDESIEQYGRRTGTYENTEIEDPELLWEEASEYLKEVAWPKLELQADTVIDPEWPEIRVGDYIRVVTPKGRGINEVVRILEERRQFDSAESVTLGLNTELKNIIDVILSGEKRILPAIKVAPPTNLAAVGGREFIDLTWTGSADYFVIEHSADGINYTVLEQQWAGRRYRHQGLELGSQHWYKVSAVRDRIRSSPSGPVSALAKDEVPPAAPTGVSATSIIRGIRITCAVPPEPDWALTECHISTESGFEPGEDTIKASGKQNCFEITDLEPETVYYCRLIHVDESGNKSEPSIEVGAVAGQVHTRDIATNVTVEGNLAYVASGVAENGARIYLPWPENRYPFVVTSANGLMTFDHTRSGYDQQIKVYSTEPVWDVNEEKWYFNVYGMLLIPGVVSSWEGSGALPYSTTAFNLANTSQQTTAIEVEVSARFYGVPYDSGLPPPMIGFEVRYKKTTDTDWNTDLTGHLTGGVLFPGDPPGTIFGDSFVVRADNLEPAEYQIQVRVIERLGAQQYGIDMGGRRRYEENQILHNGTITWMATA